MAIAQPVLLEQAFNSCFNVVEDLPRLTQWFSPWYFGHFSGDFEEAVAVLRDLST